MTFPTIGRVVYYQPAADTLFQSLDTTQPFRADVLFVNPDNTVNLRITDHVGNTYTNVNVLFQDDPEAKMPAGEGYAFWMPYQLAQQAVVQPAPAPVV